jgi:hypothetical protein
MDTNKTMRIPERKTPVIEADVFVAGAGTAGCIAAIAAARKGARVVLVEKAPVPTGTFTNGGIVAFSFHAATVDPQEAKRIVGGLPYELITRIKRAGGSSGFIPIENSSYPCPYYIVSNAEVAKGVVSEILMEAGVKVYLQTMFCGVALDGDAISAAFIENKSGRFAVVASQYIDATGDGLVAHFVGLEQTEHWQRYDQVCGGPTGLVFGIGGIDFDRAMAEDSNGFRKRIDYTPDPNKQHLGLKNYVLAHISDPKKYKDLCSLDINYFTSFYSLYPNHATYINNSKGIITDASQADNLSQAELLMRIKIMRLAQAFKKDVAGFEDSYMTWAATQLGIRSSKITFCDKMLTQEEISQATRFEDEIGLYGFHDLAPKREHCKIQAPGFYGLPYRMLLPQGCRNLFMAGRCITADIEAHMSTRNTVSCMLMGQGAGVAAAMCAQKQCDTRSLPYTMLRDELLKQDVILSI